MTGSGTAAITGAGLTGGGVAITSPVDKKYNIRIDLEMCGDSKRDVTKETFTK